LIARYPRVMAASMKNLSPRTKHRLKQGSKGAVGLIAVVGVALLIVWLLGGFGWRKEGSGWIPGDDPLPECRRAFGSSKCKYFRGVNVVDRETGRSVPKNMNCVPLKEDDEPSSSESVVCRACDGTFIFASAMPYGESSAHVFPVRTNEYLAASSAYYNQRC
jgi:hypothetical protein